MFDINLWNVLLLLLLLLLLLMPIITKRLCHLDKTLDSSRIYPLGDRWWDALSLRKNLTNIMLEIRIFYSRKKSIEHILPIICTKLHRNRGFYFGIGRRQNLNRTYEICFLSIFLCIIKSILLLSAQFNKKCKFPWICVRNDSH